MATTTIRTIKTADLTSSDPTISVPDEVHELSDGTWLACHAEYGDVAYETLAALESAYGITVPGATSNDPRELGNKAIVACAAAIGVPARDVAIYLCEFRPLDAGTDWDKRHDEIATALAKHVGGDADAVGYATVADFIEIPDSLRAAVIEYLAP